MKRTLALVALAACLATVAIAQAPAPVTFRNDNRTVLADCGVDGGSTASVARGHYLLRVTDADAFLCVYTDGGTGCPGLGTNGDKLSKDTVLIYRVPPAGTNFSCRSFDGGADVNFTRVDVNPGP